MQREKLWLHVQLSIYVPAVAVWATGTAVFRIFSAAVNSPHVWRCESACGRRWPSEVLCISLRKTFLVAVSSRSPTLWGNAEKSGVLRALNTNVALMLQSWAHVPSPHTSHTPSIYVSLSLTPAQFLKVLTLNVDRDTEQIQIVDRCNVMKNTLSIAFKHQLWSNKWKAHFYSFKHKIHISISLSPAICFQSHLSINIINITCCYYLSFTHTFPDSPNITFPFLSFPLLSPLNLCSVRPSGFYYSTRWTFFLLLITQLFYVMKMEHAIY